MSKFEIQNKKFKVNSMAAVESLEHDFPFTRCGEGYIAETFNSGFELSHDTYNGIYRASDGNIYYILCSTDRDEGGKMYCFEPSSKKISLCGDLTEICGEKGLMTIPQGKSHVTFIESGDKLFFGTHIGYYDVVDGMDMFGAPPRGYKPYPGGHILSYDLRTKLFIDYGIVPESEGVLTMNMDVRRGIIYGITWPTGFFFSYDINKREMKNFGAVSQGGENDTGNIFRVLCRSIGINPNDGAAYFSASEGHIFKCIPNADKLELVGKESLMRDYFGQYDPATPGHMAYHWRQILWHDPSQLFYGVHGNSGYLFSFDPNSLNIEVVERITSVPSRRTGMFDQFSYGYLGFALGLDMQTVYYLTGAPAFENGKRVTGKSATGKGEAKGIENLHLVTFNIQSGSYRDHGPITFENGQSPLYVNSITIGLNGTIYFLGRITENGATRTDLIRIRYLLEN